MRATCGILLGAVLLTAPSTFGQTRPKQARPAKQTRPATQSQPATAAPATPQSADPAAPFPLETLRIQGNQKIPTEKIVALAGLKIGQKLVKADFDAARSRLLATGAFESVAYEFKPSAADTGYDGVFQVVEVGQLYSYRFEDLPVSDETLRAALRKQEPLLGEQIPATREVLERYEKALKESLGGQVEVSGRLNNEIPGQLTILFRPPTTRANIAEVHFTGNNAVQTPVLMRRISDVGIGAPFSDTNMRVLLDSSIRPLYEAQGRIRVAFPQITTERSKKVDGLVVTIAVDEGPVYNVGTVRFGGMPAGSSPAPASKSSTESGKPRPPTDISKWAVDGAVNFDNVNTGVEALQQSLRRQGYLHVSGRVERTIHDQERTVDLLVAITPGPQFTLGKLEIVGLDLIGEPAVRKMWAMKEGAPFDPLYPDNFLTQVRQADMFDNLGKTNSESKVNEESKTVDVTLRFPGAAAQAEELRRKRLP